MKYSLAIYIFLISFNSCNSKIDLDNYLQGGVWCGYSELSGGEICIEFLEKDAICNSPSSYKSGFTSFMQSVCLCSEDVITSINYWNRRSN